MSKHSKDNALKTPGIQALIQRQLKAKETLEAQPPMSHAKAVANQKKLRRQSVSNKTTDDQSK